jgi:molecular chaperone Hsp33
VHENDRLIQGMAWGGDFRIIAAQTTQAVEEARLRSDLSPVATAAIGRAMTGAVLLARLLDKQVRNQWVTLRFDGSGPLGSLIAEGTVAGTVRGFVSNPHVDDNRVDVGAAIGPRGNLTVVRGTPPQGTPYTSQVSLVSGEIAKDLAHYLARSEQIASAVLLGVLVRPNGVHAAGGMIIQRFPHASDSAIDAMEKSIKGAPPFSTLLDKMPLEDAVQEILRGSDYKSLDPSFNIPIRYSCSCTRERALKQFAFLPTDELSEIITEGGSEAVCQFCGQKYFFSGDDLLALSAAPDA